MNEMDKKNEKAQLSYEELDKLLQSGKIDHLQFVMNSEEHRQDFIDWCEGRGCDKTKEMAQFYLEWHTASAEERRVIENAEICYYIESEKATRSKKRESSKDRRKKKPSLNRPFHTGALSWKHQLLMLLGDIARFSGRIVSFPFSSAGGKNETEPKREEKEAVPIKNINAEKKDTDSKLSSSNDGAVKINALPYEELAKLGFSRKTVDGWSDDIRNALMNGEPTPILDAQFRRDSRKISCPVKLQLAKGDDGKIRLLTSPAMAHVKRSNKFSAKEWDSLLQGNPLVMEETLGRKRTVTVYQLDPETNSVRMSRDIDRIVNDIAKSAALYGTQAISDAQIDDLMTGKPIEVLNGTHKMTFGIDLNAPENIKMMDGGLEQWNKDIGSRYERSLSESISQKATLGKSVTI